METPVPYVVGPAAALKRVVLMQCPLAGFSFHAAEKCWRQLRVGDPLALIREPTNHHDARAVRVEWNGLILGYVPRDANYTVSQLIDRGGHVEGRIAALRECSDAWQRILLTIEWVPAAEANRPRHAKPPEVSHVNLGSFVVGPPPSKVQLAPGARTVQAFVTTEGARAIERCLADITARLAMPLTGTTGSATRSVRLWGLLEVAITRDGRSLEMRPVHEALDSMPLLTPGLATLLGDASWSAPFSALLRQEMQARGRRGFVDGPSAAWLQRCLQRTFEGFVDFKAMRRAVLQFLAPDVLSLSLANRIFDGAPDDKQFNWCGLHRTSLALAAVEQPRLLPFLRFPMFDKKLASRDPRQALPEALSDLGIGDEALKRLATWGIEPFHWFSEEVFPPETTRSWGSFANLLHRLGVSAPPSFFCCCAGGVANLAIPYANNDDVFGTVVPDWFMRALLRAVESFEDDEEEIELGQEVSRAMPWIISAPPSPDSNQCKAGWRWIMQRVAAFEAEQPRHEWQVPLAETTIDGFRVVPMRSLAQLKTEALEMKNCLLNYGSDCRSGSMVVFSIQAPNGKRVADMAAVKRSVHGNSQWLLHQVAGKGNAPVPADIQSVATKVMFMLAGIIKPDGPS